MEGVGGMGKGSFVGAEWQGRCIDGWEFVVWLVGRDQWKKGEIMSEYVEGC